MDRSDDGLLEYLRDLGRSQPRDKRSQAIEHLATGVLDRRLFKLIGRAEGQSDKAVADEKYKLFGSADARREVERKAARLAGLDSGWKVVIWLPDPNMRLKVAEVLVDNGDGVAPLHKVFDAGQQIVDQHKQLWAIEVYADPDIRGARSTRQADVLLASIKTDMDLDLKRWDGSPVQSLHDFAVSIIADHAKLGRKKAQRLLALMPAAWSGDDETFETRLRQDYWETAVEAGFVEGDPPPGL